jgi:quercetin dioxygenase-like cupin family protein
VRAIFPTPTSPSTSSITDRLHHIVFVSRAFAAGGLQLVRLPGGWTGEVHVPKRQFLLCLDGRLEVTASDGEKRSFGPGDCVLMEDVDGKGHGSHVRSGHDCVAAIVPID